ncbi:MAG: site-specific integrase [Thomasclavelia sp.]|nr:site-specific integrase [Thomasclavelia sp.]
MAAYKDIKRNTWYCDVKYKNALGEWKHHTKRGFLTKREALNYEAYFLTNDKKSTSNMTLDELFDSFNDYQKLRVKPSTYLTDKRRYLKHVSPYFGSKRLSTIKPIDISKWIKELSKSFKPIYCNSILSTLKKLVNYSNKVLGYTYNPATNISPLKNEKRIAEINIWTPDEFSKFYNSLDSQKKKVLFRTLYFTGMRKGELLALTWKDFKNGSLIINKGYSYANGGVSTPKTNNSYRTVLLDNTTNNMLDDYHNYCMKLDGYSDSFYIFGEQLPLPPETIRRWLKKGIKESGVKDIRLHDFRHSHVSMLINEGMPVIAIAGRIGDTTSTVLDVYSHLMNKSSQEVVDFLNKLD